MISFKTLRAASPATSLLWVVLCFAIADATQRIMPMAAGKLIVFLMPLLWLGALGTGRFRDLNAARWFLLAVAGLVWMGLVQEWNPYAVEVGWWRWSGRCLALAAALVVATGGIAASTHLRVLGATSGLVVIMSIGVIWYRTRSFNTCECYGLGNINVLANTTGPALLGWLFMTIVAWWEGRRPRWFECLLITLGLTAFAMMVILSDRRGAQLAAFTVFIWIIWWWCIRRWPRWTWVGSILLICLIISVIWKTPSSERSLVSDSSRFQMYQAAGEAIAERPITGYGEEGALRLSVVDTDTARHMTAAGVKTTHVHCEFIDIGLAGGLPGMILFLVLLLWLVWRAWRITDQSVAAGIQAAGAALVVHLTTDNALGFETTAIYMGCMAGIVLASPTTDKRPAPTWLPSAWWLLPPLVLMSIWNASWGWTAAWAGNEADILRTCIRNSRDPEIVYICATTALDNPTKRRSQIVSMTVERMGWTDKMAYQAMKDRAENGTTEEQVAATVRYLNFKPFNAEAYRYLHSLLKHLPSASKELDPRLLHRIAWISDTPHASTPDLQIPVTFDDAIDSFAALHWALIHHPEWPSIVVIDQALRQSLNDVNEIAILHERVVAASSGKK